MRKSNICIGLCVLLAIFSNSQATQKRENVISVEQMYANHPRVVSKKECEKLFVPGLFSALSRTEKTVITSPDRDLTIGPRTRRIVDVGGTQYLMTSFLTEFNAPVAEKEKPKKSAKKKPKKKEAKPVNKNKNSDKSTSKKQKQGKEQADNIRKLGPDTAQSYFIAPLDNSRRGFLSTVYCDAVLKMAPK